jgi:DNA-binding transcriptional ArsR family regulator
MEGERSVSEIEAATGVRQPNLSRDLARLRAAGLVQTAPGGQAGLLFASPMPHRSADARHVRGLRR